jgi:hypothetical protein
MGKRTESSRQKRPMGIRVGELGAGQRVARLTTEHAARQAGSSAEQGVEGHSGHPSDLRDSVGSAERTQDIAGDEVEDRPPSARE